MTDLTRIDLPVCDFNSAMELQLDCVARVHADPTRAYLILTEHDPPVISTDSREESIAWRGPGQLAAYPVLLVGDGEQGVAEHVMRLHQAVVNTLATVGIRAVCRDDRLGVWVGDAKVASVTVAVDRQVCYHGVTINVSNDLSAFDTIAAGGKPDAVTSVAALLDADVRIDTVADSFATCFRELTGLDDSPVIA
jgi:lipoyl(octanoyl) transferase